MLICVAIIELRLEFELKFELEFELKFELEFELKFELWRSEFDVLMFLIFGIQVGQIYRTVFHDKKGYG